ncbi:MAG: hypothetical protein Q7V31_12045 [Parvibaculum sp.]|uniref:hypothetical protein n=1 Tax=Parvibaculum sp. TaxID=2024848 RepID=UPI002721B2DE|nr:hypothetical protein [Parvibaculum sp.]MDO8839648.1 hypothetical protein [Parvibaculum sp.]
MAEPTAKDVEYLKQHPDAAPAFDRRFGEGAATRLSGGADADSDNSVLVNIGAGVVDGVLAAASETTKFADKYVLPALAEGFPVTKALSGVAEALTGAAVVGDVGEGTPAVQQQDNLSILSEDSTRPDDISYALPKGAAQFISGFVGAGKLTAFTKTATRTGAFTKAAVEGGIADAVVFDPRDPRFANMLQETFPGMESDIINYLAASDDDSDAEGRLKNVLEGMSLGVLSEGVLLAFRGIKAVFKADSPEAAQAAAKSAADAVEAAVPPQTFDRQADLFPEDLAASIARAPQRDVPAPNFQTVNPEAIAATTSRIMADATSELTIDTIVRMASTDTRAINFARVNGSIDMQQVMQVTGDAIGPAVTRALGGSVESHVRVRDQALKAWADDTGETLGDTLAQLERFSKDAAEQAKLLTFGRITSAALSRDIADVAKKINLGQATDVEKAQLVHMVRALEDVMGATQVVRTAAARATSAGRIRIGADLSPDQIGHLKALSVAGGEKGIAKMAARLAATGGSPYKVRAVMKRSAGRKFIDVMNENFINAILSGPKTHMVNMLSNATMTVMDPLTTAAGAAIMGDMRTAREAYQGFAMARMAVADSYEMAKIAFRTGDNVLDTHSTVDDRIFRNAISSEALGMSVDGTTGRATTAAGRAVDAMGVALNVPTRLLLTEDEFFKQIAYRTNFYGQLFSEASDMGLKGAGAKRYVTDEFEKRALNTAGGAATVIDPVSGKEVLTANAARAINAARNATFTHELPAGTLGNSVQGFVNRHPAARLIAPFIRTPTNLLKTAAAYTPGANMILKEHRNALWGEGVSKEVRARAVGQMAVGTALVGAITAEVINGNVTGAGPSDHALRAMWIEAGWQPYSIRIGDRWVSYQRLDPFATIIGVLADSSEIYGQLEGSDKTYEDMTLVTALALGKTLSNKLYFQGITDLIDAVSSPDRPDKANALIQQMTTSMLPYSAMLGQTTHEMDNIIREVRTVQDRFKSRLPGWSETLPARVSWLTGEPAVRPDTFLSPITSMPIKGNEIADELIRIGVAYSPSKTLYGVELTGAEYSALNKTMATVTDSGGRNVQAKLRRLFDSPAYDSARARLPDTPEGVEGARQRATRKVIEAYHSAAVKRMMAEDPVFNTKMRAAKVGAAAAKSAKPATQQKGIELLNSVKP